MYMQKYRSTHPDYKKRERERDNAYKLKKRRTDPDWLAAERARRRRYGKISRYRNQEKDLEQARKYRRSPTNQIKEQARRAVLIAVKGNKITRPKACEKCEEIPEPMKNKRYPLRADHYKGYEKSNWLVVQWICVNCDGKQLRSKEPLVKK